MGENSSSATGREGISKVAQEESIRHLSIPSRLVEAAGEEEKFFF